MNGNDLNSTGGSNTGNDGNGADERAGRSEPRRRDRENDRFGQERRERFKRVVEEKRRRKMKARADRGRDLWFGLGMFGLVGWAVAIPTLVGLALGIWIDTRWPGRFSWTIMLLFVGVAVGCLNAWYWITRQQQSLWKDEAEDGREARREAAQEAEEEAGGRSGGRPGQRPQREEDGRDE